MLPKKECIHFAEVLEKAKTAILKKDSSALKDLSNSTVHSACSYQDGESIAIAIMLYALSKLIERDDFEKFRNWDLFVKKFNNFLSLAIKALNEGNKTLYEKYVQQARKTLTSESVSLRPYIQEIMKKASLNKGSKIHEHGISRELAARLLGVSQWELSPYIGQKEVPEKQDQTIGVRTRAQMALEFFS